MKTKNYSNNKTMTNREIAQEISSRIGNSPVPFDSVYSIALQIYNELGGTSEDFDSVYSILLEILPLASGVAHIDDSSISTESTWSSSKINEEIQQGGGGKAIEEVDELPEASENKEKFFRLSSDDNVYVSELKSRTTITTNRLPDAQQIDKAYLYDDGDMCYYKGSYKVILTDGEIDGYGWYKTYDGGIWYMYISEDNAVNINGSTILYSTNNDEMADIEIDTVNKVITIPEMTVADLKLYYSVIVGESAIFPIPATYNAPESAQIGNATCKIQNLGSYTYVYTGVETTIEVDEETLTVYKWDNGDVNSDFQYCFTTKPASEMYFNNDRGILTDVKCYLKDSEKVIFTSLYIPQLNAPDSEQVGNAYITSSDETYYYSNATITMVVADGSYTLHRWGENYGDIVTNVYTIIPTNEIYNLEAPIFTGGLDDYVWDVDGDTITNLELTKSDIEGNNLYSPVLDGETLYVVKYQREETIEEWDWQPLTDNATNDDIDLMFGSPIGGTITLIREQDAEQQAAGYVDWWVNTEGETMEYEGNTYYKWISWYNSEDNISPTEKPDYVMLTNTLDITLPFNTDSPEYEYTIRYDSEEGAWGDGGYFRGDYTQKTVQ